MSVGRGSREGGGLEVKGGSEAPILPGELAISRRRDTLISNKNIGLEECFSLRRGQGTMWWWSYWSKSKIRKKLNYVL
jgi:hypothetical protein